MVGSDRADETILRLSSREHGGTKLEEAKRRLASIWVSDRLGNRLASSESCLCGGSLGAAKNANSRERYLDGDGKRITE